VPAGSIGSQVDRVLLAAEKAADSIRDEAREWAQAYTEEARRRADELAAERVQELGRLTDSLIARAREVARQSDELVSALDEAGRKIINGIGTEVPGGAPAAREDFSVERMSLRPDQPAAGREASGVRPPAASDPEAGGHEDPAHDARLAAIKMAIAGSSREEIANRLYDEYEIRDPTAILNEIWN
jgi:vacuolar-type H+-ATPase subunit H